jgi:transcriptional regulator with XRE-family HTH domain
MPSGLPDQGISVGPVTEPADSTRGQLEDLGRFIREQRERAELSMRELAKRANISNPYLSQIERGLHEPSVRVLTSLAGALELSAEALLRGAGLLGDDDGSTRRISTEDAIRADPELTAEQRTDLLTVYRSYLDQNAHTGT